MLNDSTPHDGQPQTSLGRQAELRASLDILEQEIADLKTEYELFFTGISPLPPDKLMQAVVRKIREMERSPLKATSLQYRLRSLRSRFNTYSSYIQRVLREREAGTYHRDVYKADLRSKARLAAARAETEAGKAELRMRELFRSYRDALGQAGGGTELSFEAFHDALVERAREVRSATGAKRVSFAIVNEDGRVTVKIQPRAG